MNGDDELRDHVLIVRPATMREMLRWEYGYWFARCAGECYAWETTADTYAEAEQLHAAHVAPAESISAPTLRRADPVPCPTCSGQGTVEAYGGFDGRFYNIGSRRTCPDCAGSKVRTEFDPHAKLSELLDCWANRGGAA